ncbi:MAG TPA: hypothetical protein VGM19_09555 [Armatimonadota bacterium]|jgi:hypothetical protein
MSLTRALTLGLALLLVTVAASAAVPAGVQLPLVLWDVNFNADPVGRGPQPLTKAQIEAAGTDDWAKLPLRTYSALEYVTRTRTATVEKEALGLTDQPVLFVATENAQPHYGPRMWISLPYTVAKECKRLQLSLDVAMGSVTIMGGVHLWDAAGIEFYEDGSIKVGTAEVGRYQANTPVHLDALIDVSAKTVTLTVDGRADAAITVPWTQPRATVFSSLVLDALLPGGHAWPGRIAFDNIKLVLLEAQ